MEIEWGDSTSPTATAWLTQAPAKATPMAGTYTDCLKKIITELEVEATGTTAIAYAADANDNGRYIYRLYQEDNHRT